ncbi:PA2779 family protein [Thalassospiraceae bacterium LMO-JJ14]|nr:PA2779 family protein [Thalassospiraceae bacterium LMO-JJ14]
MVSKKFRFKAVAIAIITAFSVTLMPIVPVSAALVNNNQVVEQQTVQGDRDLVNDFMSRADVRAQFEQLGVNADEANLRVAALSDVEVAKLANEIKSSPAGQGAIGGIIGAIVLIFIILLITDLLGFTSVFGWTNKGSANPT